MPRSSRYTGDDSAGGAPEWMVTFSDCMTLLLTFFVLLLSFATFDPETLPLLGESFAKALPSIGMSSRHKADSVYKKQESNDEYKQDEGSNVKTNARKQTSNFMKEKKPLDFRNLKVFSMDSESFFWGKAWAISKDGREVLDALAKYFSHRTGRIVIGESGPEEDTSLGLNRSLAILNYLANKHGIEKSRFSVTAQSTMRQAPKQRQVEITLLDRSVYE